MKHQNKSFKNENINP